MLQRAPLWLARVPPWQAQLPQDSSTLIESAGEVKQAEQGRKRDLDETRRLAYMALMSKGNRNYELAATIANALVHHQQAAAVGDALIYLTTLADDGSGNTDESEEWLNEQIWAITEKLGDYPIAEREPT